MSNPTQPQPSKQRIEHFSLDPPDVKTPLVFPYRPLKGRPSKKQFQDALASKPLDILPRSLIPRSWLPLKPPILHFGLEVDEGAVIAYAEKHHCVVRYSELGQEDEDDLPDDGKTPWCNPRWPDVAVDFTIMCAVETAMKEIYGPDGVPRFSVEGTGHRAHKTIVSLFTNYELTRRSLPSQEEVKRLAEILGVKAQPKWFLDLVEMFWRRD